MRAKKLYQRLSYKGTSVEPKNLMPLSQALHQASNCSIHEKMKHRLVKIIFLSIAILSSCINFVDKANLVNSAISNINQSALIPIKYDFDNLNLYLNSSVEDTSSKIEWRWDHMNSNNGMPDSTGIEYYENRSQPVFFFNGETTLPALSIKTDKNKIIEFSVTVIFNLPDREQKTITCLMDSLRAFNLLDDEIVRMRIIETGKYMKSSDTAEEEVTLELKEHKYGYDRMTYSIRLK